MSNKIISSYTFESIINRFKETENDSLETDVSLQEELSKKILSIFKRLQKDDPFYETDLIEVSDDAPFVPLNGIRSTDLKDLKQKYGNLDDTCPLFSITGPEDFKKQTQRVLKTILSRQICRDQFTEIFKYLNNKAIPIQPGPETLCSTHPLSQSIEYHIAKDKCLATFYTRKGKELLESPPDHLALAHEFSHLLHYLENRDQHDLRGLDTINLFDGNFDDREEQLTATGWDQEPDCAFRNGLSEVDYPLISEKYDRFNEQNFAASFSQPILVNHHCIENISQNNTFNLIDLVYCDASSNIKELFEKQPEIKKSINTLKGKASGCTAMTKAAMYNNLGMIQLLIDNGANDMQPDNHLKTAYQRAVEAQAFKVAGFLLKKNKEYYQKDNRWLESAILAAMATQKPDPQMKNILLKMQWEEQQAKLGLIKQQKVLEFIKEAQSWGFDISARNANKENIFVTLLKTFQPTRTGPLFTYLIENNVDTFDIDGKKTSIFIAIAKSGNLALLRTMPWNTLSPSLLPDINAQDSSGKTALVHALENSTPPIGSKWLTDINRRSRAAVETFVNTFHAQVPPQFQDSVNKILKET